MKSISLLDNWMLCDQDISLKHYDFEKVLNNHNEWMQIKSLPCDVHTPLIECKRIEEPLIADNSFNCSWIEDKSFWFVKKFNLTQQQLSPHGVELFIETLDIHADILLNGQFVAHHSSAMYPFVKNVRSFLKEGENTLVIRLTTGLEQVSDSDIAEVRDSVACEFRRRREGRGDDRRCALRKPQYVFGWDQAPRLATCAIAGDVRLDILDEAVIRDIYFETQKIDKHGAHVQIQLEIESRRLVSASECDVVLEVSCDGKCVYRTTENYMSQPGINFREYSFVIKNPKLWWPNGYGEQHLYTINAYVKNNNGATDQKQLITGVRTVELDTSAINKTERNYAFLVNGVRIYARGSDFIFSDSLYARIPDSLQKKLITAAKDANFNMLRFWDGNVYQSDYVYELCDRLGIMVIQNFCFACSAYPDHLDWFRKEVENEANCQIKRLRNHPSLAMWYGNGENSSILTGYLDRNFFNLYDSEQFGGGTYIYNTLLPNLCRKLCKKIGYQCTTPLGDYTDGECAERGDRHYYPFLNTAPENQQYRISTESIDALKCKFITESGIMGPPSKNSLIKYCGGEHNITDKSSIFLHHKNTFEKDAVRDGIYKHYTGQKQLSLDEYCLYGGLFQGTMIGYEAEHIRVQPHCGGSLFWVLNDGFGEVGFSFMDHFGNPKPVYYFLKRAYAPKKLILKKYGDDVLVYCTNNTHNKCSFKLEYGYTDFAGNKTSKTKKITLKPHTDRKVIAKISLNGFDVTKGVFFAKTNDSDIIPSTLHACDFSLLQIPKKANVWVEDVKCRNGKTEFTVCTNYFAHAVYFNADEQTIFSDQYFDLLPNEKRKIVCYGECDITADCIFC